MKSPLAADPTDRHSPCRVLVVDDSAEGRAALARVLEVRGYEVQTVSAGAEALEILGSAGVPEIVITDLVLPDLDGRDVARAAKRARPRPWVVLITGWGFEAAEEELTEAGIHLLLPKPLDVRELCRKLDAMVASGPPHA